MPPPRPASRNTISYGARRCSTSSRHSSIARRTAARSPPLPRPRNSLWPSRIRSSTRILERCASSVLTAIERTPGMPRLRRSWTASLPAPPSPTTAIAGPRASGVHESGRVDRSVILPPARQGGGEPSAGTASPSRRWVRAGGESWSIRLRMYLPDGRAYGVVDADRVSFADELLEAAVVLPREFDHDLADVLRGKVELDVLLEPFPDRVGDRRRPLVLLKELQPLEEILRDPDRDPLRCVGHLRQTIPLALSDD